MEYEGVHKRLNDMASNVSLPQDHKAVIWRNLECEMNRLEQKRSLRNRRQLGYRFTAAAAVAVLAVGGLALFADGDRSRSDGPPHTVTAGSGPEVVFEYQGASRDWAATLDQTSTAQHERDTVDLTAVDAIPDGTKVTVTGPALNGNAAATGTVVSGKVKLVFDQPLLPVSSANGVEGSKVVLQLSWAGSTESLSLGYTKSFQIS